MKHAKSTGIQKIIKFWSGIVFQGIDTGSVINEQIADMNDEEEANFALAMERVTIDAVDTDEEDDLEDFDFEMGHRE